MSSGWLPRIVGLTAEVTAVGLFLATIFGLVSLFFAIEAQVASHEFRFLGFGILLSSASVLRSKGLKDATCVGWFGDNWDC